MKKINLYNMVSIFVVLLLIFPFLATYTANVQAATGNLNKERIVLKEGKGFQLKMSSNGKKVVWKSWDTRIATVSGNGYVKAVKAGTAYISAHSGEYKRVCRVTVKSVPSPEKKNPVKQEKTLPNNVEIGRKTLELTIGESYKLNVDVRPSTAKPYVSEKWESDKKSVAVVNSKGQVIAYSEGTAVIKVTVTSGNYKKICTCAVTVKAPPEEKPDRIDEIKGYIREYGLHDGEYSSEYYLLNFNETSKTRFVYDDMSEELFMEMDVDGDEGTKFRYRITVVDGRGNVELPTELEYIENTDSYYHKSYTFRGGLVPAGYYHGADLKHEGAKLPYGEELDFFNNIGNEYAEMILDVCNGLLQNHGFSLYDLGFVIYEE